MNSDLQILNNSDTFKGYHKEDRIIFSIVKDKAPKESLNMPPFNHWWTSYNTMYNVIYWFICSCTCCNVSFHIEQSSVIDKNNVNIFSTAFSNAYVINIGG